MKKNGYLFIVVALTAIALIGFHATAFGADCTSICQNCHTATAPVGDEIAGTFHPTTAGTPVMCIECHQQNYATCNTTGIAHTGSDWTTNIVPIACVGCHGQNTCGNVHTEAELTPFATGMHGSLPMQHISTSNIDCAVCHGGAAGVTGVIPGAPYMTAAALGSYASGLGGLTPVPDVLPPSAGCDGSLAPTGTLIAVTTNSQPPVNCGTDPVTLLKTCNIGVPGQIEIGANANQAADAVVWWGDGAGLENSPIAHSFRHTYNNIGRFQVILTVTNACGFKAQEVMIVNATGGSTGKGTIELSQACATEVSYNVKATGDTVSITSGKMDRNVVLDAGCYDITVGLPAGLPTTAGTCTNYPSQVCKIDLDCPVVNYSTTPYTHDTCNAVAAPPSCTWTVTNTTAGESCDATGCTNVCVTAGENATMTGN